MSKNTSAYEVFKSFVKNSPVGAEIVKKVDAQLKSIKLIEDTPISDLKLYHPARKVKAHLTPVGDDVKMVIYDHLGELGFKTFKLEDISNIVKEEGFLAA